MHPIRDAKRSISPARSKSAANIDTMIAVLTALHTASKHVFPAKKRPNSATIDDVANAEPTTAPNEPPISDLPPIAPINEAARKSPP